MTVGQPRRGLTINLIDSARPKTYISAAGFNRSSPGSVSPEHFPHSSHGLSQRSTDVLYHDHGNELRRGFPRYARALIVVITITTRRAPIMSLIIPSGDGLTEEE